MKNLIFKLFILHLITRIIFILCVGFYNNYSLQTDATWLVELGNQGAKGNYDFQLPRFVVSPLYPFLLAMFKNIFQFRWDTALVIFQWVISAVSGVYIFKIGEQLFDRSIGLLATLLFAIYPFTFWYVNSFSQETLFQSLFIFSFYFLVRACKEKKVMDVILSSVYFSLAYLTKSHILLFSLFVPFIFLICLGWEKRTFVFISLYAGIALLLSMPYGLFQHSLGNSYVISSNGAGYQFYLGNTETGYRTVVDVPSKGTEEYKINSDINKSAAYFNGSQVHYDSILNLSQAVKQKVFFKEGIDWIKSNPVRFLKMKVYDFMFFVMPGLNWKHYSFATWLFSFFLSLPIYFFAYWAMISLLRSRHESYPFIWSLFFAMVLFSVVWYVQNRFRTITIEPFYLIFASYAIFPMILKWPFCKTMFNWIQVKLIGEE